MHESVRTAFWPFTEKHEGVTDFMYLDAAKPVGFVTTGIGNLIDPVALALALPWKRADGSLATTREIAAEWMAIKAMQADKDRGGFYFRQFTRLRLDRSDVEALVARKFDEHERALAARYAGWNDWPADAQLATHSMAWACGAAFGYAGDRPFRKLDAALHARDFETAALECTINPQIGSIVRRNEANRLMYRNAAKVQAWKLDPSEVHFPIELVEVPHEPVPPTLRPEDLAATRIIGTSEAMREVFRDPPVIIVDDTDDGEGEA